MSGHTKEPWRVTPDGHIASKGFVPIRTPFREDAFKDGPNRSDHSDELLLANARRIVACVNACAGIPTEDLERYYNDGGGIDAAMQEAALSAHITAVKQRDRMLGALRLALAALEANSDEVPHGFGGEIEAVRSAIGDRLMEAPAEPGSVIYSYSIDGEMFHGEFVSPEDAAADGLLSNPDAPAIEVAECVRRPASAFVSGEFVVEDAQQRAFDSCGEAAEDWLNDVVVDRAAMDELERHVGDWLQARDPVTFFEVINVRTITRAELIASGHLEADD